MKYSNLLAPLVLPNGVVLKNRLLSSNALPHFLQGPETWLNDPIMVYQVKVAQNAAIVTIGDWSNPKQHEEQGDGGHFPSFNLADPSVENSLALYCDVIQMQGSKALMTIAVNAPDGYDVCERSGKGLNPFHMGAQGDADDEDFPPPPPSPFGGADDEEAEMTGIMAQLFGPKKEISKEQLANLIQNTAGLCKKWKNIGFDGVSLHMAYQGTLAARFLSPETNHRTDEYGGSIENRARFPLTLCQAIKDACGKSFIVEVIMSGREINGFTVEDTVAFAELAQGKVDIIQIRGGNGDESHPTTFDSTEIPMTLAIAEKVKQANLNIAVAPIGGFQNPDLAETWLSENKMDLMGAARAFICEPDYLKKLHEGRGEDVVPCIRCNKCHGLSMEGPWISVCSVNPQLGLDHVKERIFQPASKRKRVAVLGGGPAGMYCACLLADRGHEVTLIEAADRLGGQLIHADFAKFKWTIRNFKDWQIKQCEKKGVNIRLNTTVTPDELWKEKFDVVVAALGGKPNIPDIPGLKKADGSLQENVFTPISVFGDIDKLGQRVAVIGGSEIGCETGMYVAETGRDVTVFTRQDQLAPSARRVHYGLPALGYHGLKQKLCCTTVGVQNGSVVYRNYKQEEKSLEFDSIIISGGVTPCSNEALQYAGCAPEFYIAGDCAGDGQGTIQKCLRSAYGVAMQI